MTEQMECISEKLRLTSGIGAQKSTCLILFNFPFTGY